jgi:transcriptional regulator with XRE-family HTH domain
MLKLKEIRLSRNRTQEEVSDFLKITRASYTNIENGKRDPDTQTLMALADYFQVSMDEIFGRSQKTIKKPSFTLSEEEKRLILDYRDFNEKGKSKIREEIYTMTLAGIYKNPDDLPDLGKIGGKK